MESRPVVASYCATFLKPEMLHIYRQITGLKDFRSAVFTQKRENSDRFPVSDLQVVGRGAGKWLRRFWQRQICRQPVTLSTREARRLATAVGSANAEVMHIYFGHIAVQLLPFLRPLRIPAVVSFHGADVLVDLDRPRYRQMALEMLGLASLVLARSESLLKALRELGCPAEKLRLHRTGIPLGEFPFRERTVPQGGAWRLMQACRLVEKKGLFVTLRAFQIFHRRWPLARLTIAGEGPLEPALRTSAAHLGIDSQVDFAGFLTQDDLRAKLCEAHFFVHPSELGADGNQEGVPNSLLEAMATGLPVFATRHGGIPEAVEHEVSGWLGAEGDAEGLAGALLEAADDPARAKVWGAAAALSVAENFEQSKQVARLEEIYREAMRVWQP